MPAVSKTTVRRYAPDIEIIDTWAAGNPDPETGETPSRPVAIRRKIRSAQPNSTEPPAVLDEEDAPASDAISAEAMTLILQRL